MGKVAGGRKCPSPIERSCVEKLINNHLILINSLLGRIHMQLDLEVIYKRRPQLLSIFACKWPKYAGPGEGGRKRLNFVYILYGMPLSNFSINWELI